MHQPLFHLGTLVQDPKPKGHEAHSVQQSQQPIVELLPYQA